MRNIIDFIQETETVSSTDTVPVKRKSDNKLVKIPTKEFGQSIQCESYYNYGFECFRILTKDNRGKQTMTVYMFPGGNILSAKVSERYRYTGQPIIPEITYVKVQKNGQEMEFVDPVEINNNFCIENVFNTSVTDNAIVKVVSRNPKNFKGSAIAKFSIVQG